MSDNTITVRFFARLREDLKTDQLAISQRAMYLQSWPARAAPGISCRATSRL
jgi:hypothetical protein